MKPIASKILKTSLLGIIYSLLFALALMQNAAASMVQNGNFTAVTYSGSKPLTTLFGQFGTGTGSTLTVGNWSTTGYNFVFAPGTADAGTGAGANPGQPNQAPGQYNAPNGYGNMYLWGSNNGGLVTLPATSPAGGNFLAADGAFETAPITQTIVGLTIGGVYRLTFYWAAAQQQGFTGATTENWKVSLGNGATPETYTTPTFSLASSSFSGWMQQSFDYTATSTTETLSFLAQGTPTGQPPFLLLSGVDLSLVPECSNWMVFFGFCATVVSFESVRRRRRSSASAPGR